MGLQELLRNANSQAPVTGLTHEFYRYPARFSPQFARSAIEEFSRPMEGVMDPFMGGGTTAVEALGLGRRFLGCDLNSLSIFITRTKTTPISVPSERELLAWVHELNSYGGVRGWQVANDEWTPYQANTPWWLRRAIDIALRRSTFLNTRATQDLARCIILRTAQWALDCKQKLPSSMEFFSAMVANATEMVERLRDFKRSLGDVFPGVTSEALKHRRLIHSDAADIADHKLLPRNWDAPKLILTSPPYFGVHILYHRWQVRGRRETPAPFWIAAAKDGMGASFYTFGDRQRRTMTQYIERLHACFASIVKLMDKKSTLVQLEGV